MGKRRISFAVPYDYGKTWHVGTHIGVMLPHHTDDAIEECVIEKITKDKNSTPAKCQITAVMIGVGGGELLLSYQDGYGSQSIENTWQNGYESQSEANTKMDYA